MHLCVWERVCVHACAKKCIYVCMCACAKKQLDTHSSKLWLQWLSVLWNLKQFFLLFLLLLLLLLPLLLLVFNNPPSVICIFMGMRPFTMEGQFHQRPHPQRKLSLLLPEPSVIHSSLVELGVPKPHPTSCWNANRLDPVGVSRRQPHLLWVHGFRGSCHIQRHHFAPALLTSGSHNLSVPSSVTERREGVWYRALICGWAVHRHSFSILWPVVSFWFI